jgi:hypothetical protein
VGKEEDLVAALPEVHLLEAHHREVAHRAAVRHPFRLISKYLLTITSGRPAGSSGSGAGAIGGTTGIRPSYAGGRFYGGGATSAYAAGGRSPLGINPVFLATPFLLFPGIWAAGAFAYPDSHPYTFHNSSATNATNPNGVNQTKNVECLCAKNADCGCDDNSDTTYLSSVVGNGSYAALNKTLVNVADVNGSNTIVINGTLPSGTASTTTSGAAKVAELSGYWIMVATVLYAVWGL